MVMEAQNPHSENSHAEDFSKGLSLKQRSAIHQVISTNPNSRKADIRRAAMQIVRAEQPDAAPVLPNRKSLGRHIQKARLDVVKGSNDGFNLEELGQLKQYLDARSFNMALASHNHEDPVISEHLSR